ncbi:MAG TPA: hypothetical protein VLL98_03725 [Rickettsiales bacterium]|nr:hypothetical protein [Rickettsiales bacterium]
MKTIYDESDYYCIGGFYNRPPANKIFPQKIISTKKTRIFQSILK